MRDYWNINKKYFIIFFLFIMLGGIVSIGYIYHISWDFLSYHYYNGWAFFNNRLDLDLYPAMFRSYVNPVLDAIFYLIAETLNNHPYIFLFVNGIKLGLFMFVSYLIFDLILLKSGVERKFTIVMSLTLVMLSPILLLGMGLSDNDLQLNTITLLGFYIFLKYIDDDKHIKTNYFAMLLCGMLFGAAVGLKYAMSVSCLGIVVCALFSQKSIKDILKVLSFLLFGMFSGFLITNGFWMWTLWKHFANPMFPYFNQIFQSPLCDTSSVYNYEFIHIRPKSILGFLFFPLKNTLIPNTGLEGSWSDIKLSFIFVSCILFFILKKHINIQNNQTFYNLKMLNYTVVFIICCFYTNLFLFGNIRYVLSLFPLGSFTILLVCHMFYSVYKDDFSPTSTYVVLFLLFLYGIHIVYIANTGILYLLYIVFGILAVYIIYMFLKKRNVIKDLPINYAITSLIIGLSCLITMHHVFPALNNYFLFNGNVIKISDANIKDNSLVICGTMLTNAIIPKQTAKNVKYVGFPMPEKYTKFTYSFLYTDFRNMFLIDKVHEKRIAKLIEDNKDVYFMYAETILGEDYYDFRIYERVLSMYTNGKIKKISNCKRVPYNISGQIDIWGSIMVCKIK